MGKMRVKPKLKGNIVEVKVGIKHDMLTYDQAKQKSKKAGKEIKANFITHITGKAGSKVIYDASTSQFLSKNPVIKFKVKADIAGIKKGDKIEISWVDLLGNTQSAKGKVK